MYKTGRRKLYMLWYLVPEPIFENEPDMIDYWKWCMLFVEHLQQYVSFTCAWMNI